MQNWNKTTWIFILLITQFFAAGAQRRSKVEDAKKSPISIQKNQAKALAPTPPMGWNSWDWFGKNHINEEIVREVIDAMVREGLRDAGSFSRSVEPQSVLFLMIKKK